MTPAKGKFGFYCNKAKTSKHPYPWAIIYVGNPFSQHLVNKIPISDSVPLTGLFTLKPPLYPKPLKSIMFTVYPRLAKYVAV